VTLSIGAATMAGRVEGDCERLIGRADEMLYGAKSAGRDWVVVADDSVGAR